MREGGAVDCRSCPISAEDEELKLLHSSVSWPAVEISSKVGELGR